MGDHRKSVLN